MNDTTSILDLPTDPTGGGSISNNISLAASENIMGQQNLNSIPNAIQNPNPNSNPNSKFTLDQNTINQIVSGLQQAGNSGYTQLPSRDIPMNTNTITQDPNIQPNYIPQTQNKDYIKDYESTEDIINSYNKQSSRQDTLDEMYNEFQTPLLLAVLYFLFQLPVFKKYLFSFFPGLFNKDGNQNIYGYLFSSTLFGLIFYVVNKQNTIFGKF